LSGIFIEDGVRTIAATMFGEQAIRSFVAQSLNDLVRLLASPSEQEYDSLVSGEQRLISFAKIHFVAFVQAFFEHLKVKLNETDKIRLEKNPWVVDGKIIADNIEACRGVLNDSQRRIMFKIMRALKPEDNDMDVFRLSSGPGFSVLVWSTCGEFLSEVELDCRGKIDFLPETKKAVVMGAEIKTSAKAIPDAKKQLLRRFKIIAKCIELMYGIDKNSAVFIGRVFYRTIDKKGPTPQAEDGYQEGFKTLSFYYHRI
jgi:hypothetical protein